MGKKRGLLPLLILVMLLLAATGALTAGSNLASTLAAKVTEVSQTPLSASVQLEQRLLAAGNLALDVTNFAVLGASDFGAGRDQNVYDPNRPALNQHSSSGEFPAGSRNHHVYNGGIWVGGIVDGDTLVSLSVLGTSTVRPEFTPDSPILQTSRFPGATDYHDDARSDIQFDCAFSDTAPAQIRDESNTRDHRPLGLSITQTAYSWLSEPYDDFVILASVIKNISEATIESAHVGFFLDADVYNPDPGEGYNDDIAGCLPEVGLAYVLDNDGDPADGAWDSRSVRSAVGIAPVALEPAPTCTTFKWWPIASFSPWGGPSLGPPTGDRARYRAMATGPSMPDQMFAVLEYDTPWRPPGGSSYRDIADGMDTRVLLSAGPYTLAPGDSIVAVMAIVAGDSVHADPDDFKTYWDPLNPEEYYNRLYFGDLIRNTETARAFYERGFDPIGAAPIALSASPAGDTSIALTWQPVRFSGVTGYRIFRRDAHTTVDWQVIGETAGPLPEFVDHGVVPANDYEYAVAGIDAETGEGYKSRPIVITAARPDIVPVLSVQKESPHIELSWTLSLPRPQFSPPCYLNIYRRTDGAASAELVDQIPIIGGEPSGMRGSAPGGLAAHVGPRVESWIPIQNLMGEYTDHSAESGVIYWYAASVTNMLWLEGPRSEEVRAAPMTLDGPGIVLRLEGPFERTHGAANPGVTFYQDWAMTAGYDYTVLIFNSTNAGLDSLRRRLSEHHLLILACDEYASAGFNPWTVTMMRDHLSGGGRCVFVGRDIPTRFWASSSGPVRQFQGVEFRGFDSLGFAGGILGVRSLVKETLSPPFDWFIPSEFLAAASLREGWPDLPADRVIAFSEFPVSSYIQRIPVRGGGHLPLMSAIDSITDGEILYRFVSASPDSSPFHGKISGYARNAPGAHFVLINVPLSLIERDAAVAAPAAAVAWLEEVGQEDEFGPQSGHLREILEFLYGHRPTYRPDCDRNRDGRVDLVDVVLAIPY